MIGRLGLFFVILGSFIVFFIKITLFELKGFQIWIKR